MNNCGIINQKLLDQISDDIYMLTEEYLFDENALTSDFDNSIVEYINNLKDTFSIDDASIIAETIFESCNLAGVEEDDDFNNINNYTTLLTHIASGNTLNLGKEADINKQLQDTQITEEAKEASSDFLINSFGSAHEVKKMAQIKTNTSLFDALFVNRGSIKEASIGIVRNSDELNTNILKYQQQLLDDICSYLKTRSNLSTEVKEALKNPKLYELKNGKYVNTGILYILQDTLNRELSPNKFRASTLRSLYNTYDKNNDSKLTLDAYNAYVFLKHFDSYLELMLGKVINIKPNEFGKKTGSLSKYNLSDSTAQLATTWRTTEDFDPGDEIDMVTQLAITTTPIYKWHSEYPKKGKYLTFQHYQNILGKIKALGINPNAKKIIFNQDFIDDNYDLFNSLSEGTLEYLKNKTLSEAINYLRKNPRLYIHHIFELMANSQFKDTFSDLYSNNFIDEELNHIYSVYKGIFDPNDKKDKKSLRTLVGLNPELDYYMFIAQASDSIFKNLFIQYYRDENGNIKTRVLTDMDKFRYTTKFKSDLNAINKSQTNRQEKYNIQKINNSESEYKFKIPNTNIEIIVSLNSEKVKYNINQFSELQTNSDVLSFLDDILGLNLENNSEFLETMGSDNMGLSILKLMDFASNILMTSYISDTLLKGLSRSEQIKKASDLFGFEHKFNNSTNSIGVLSDNPTNVATIDNIVKTQLILDGQFTSTQVKDSQQSGQNLQSLSRLLGSFGSLFDLLEKLPESATKYLSILTNPDLLLEHYTTSEYYDRSTKKSKKAVKFSVSEMAYANIMDNFIPALLPAGEYDLIGGGIASFLASVNSDKGTIGLLLFNLNTKIISPTTGLETRIIDLSLNDYKQIISTEFGVFYFNIYTKIQSDFYKLHNFIINNSNYKDCPYLNYLNGFADFNEWCLLNGKNPVGLIQEAVKRYNMLSKNKFKPLELIDLIHYKSGEKIKIGDKTFTKLDNNNVLISQLARYVVNNINVVYLIAGLDGKKASGLYTELQTVEYYVNSSNYPSYDEFFDSKRLEVLWSLVKSGTQFILNDDNSVNNYLKDKHKDWIKNGKMVLARIVFNGQSYDITSKKDILILSMENNIKMRDLINNSKVILHPLLDKYNTLDFWLTQSWMDLTVGSFIAHPGKKAKGNSKNLTKNFQENVTALRALSEITIDPLLKALLENNINILTQEYNKKLALIQEAAMYQDLHKRNVSMTALMHEFILNTLNGITEDYNIAVIDDIKDFLTILMLAGCEIKPYDGATFVNPFTVYLENNSLGGAKAGIDKKQFVHFKSASTGTGGIIKTAGFGITNDRIRRSPYGWGRMMQLMTNHVWLDENGNKINIDILHGFDKKLIQYKPFYFARNGELFRIKEIKQTVDKFGNKIPNTYDRIIELVDSNGNSIKTLNQTELHKKGIAGLMVVDSNYKLWQLFGGEYSLELNENNKLVPSENSIINVVTAMNKIGIIKEGYTKDTVETLEQVFQPLKHSDLHYIATAGAVKQGGANINSNSNYNTTNFLNFLRIKMYQAGILLDKEHHADHAELSLPTLIITACASLGYTIDKANALYQGLANASYLGTKDILDLTQAYFENNTETNLNNLREKVLELVAKNLANQSSDSFAKTIAKSILQAVKDDPKLKFRNAGLPLSDNTVFNKALSTIASNINKSGIKLKIPGLLAVLTPSYNLYTLYGNKTWDELYNWTESDEALVEEYKQYLSTTDPSRLNNFINNTSDSKRLNQLLEAMLWKSEPLFDIETGINDIYRISLGRTYIIEYNNGIIQDKMINTPTDLRRLKQSIRRGIVKTVTENILRKRNLGAYNVRGRAISESGISKNFLFWELDSIYAVQTIKELQKKFKGEELLTLFVNWYQSFRGKIPTSSINDYLEYFQKEVQKDLNKLSKSVPDILKTFDKLLTEYNRQQNPELKLTKAEEINRWLRLNVDGYTLKQINFESIDEINSIKALITEQLKITIDGEKYIVNKDSIEVDPYELIMPKTFIHEFGFEQYTDLNKVKEDKDYFVKQIIRNRNLCNNRPKPKLNQYDVELLNSNGKHYYLLDASHLEGSNLRESVDEILIKEIDGKQMRVDGKGNPIYEIFEGSKIYVDAQGNEIIVVNDIENSTAQQIMMLYINNLQFSNLNLSKNLKNYGDYAENFVFDYLYDIKRPGFKDWIDEILSEYDDVNSNIIVDAFDTNNILGKVTEDNYKLLAELDPKIAKALKLIFKEGHKKHTSFLKSLEIVAARIPSLSFQSFMPMKVVAYDNPNRNAAYVSNLLILLQGSDFDIDAVSLVTYDIDSNGNLQLWSPYANEETLALANASMELPFPSGKDLDIETTSDKIKLTEIFDKYKDIIHIKRIGLKRKDGNIIKKGEFRVYVNASDVNQFRKLKQLLEETKLYKPETAKDKQDIAAYLMLGTDFSLISNANEVDLIFDAIEEFINTHNHYLDGISKYKLDKIFNNYIVHSLYSVIEDPANQNLALTSVDETTGPLKEIAELSEDAEDAHYRTSGNSINKAESISENQEGTDCIGISAVGIKGFFSCTEYFNWILNSGDADALNRLLGKKISPLLVKPLVYTNANQTASKALEIGGIDTLRHPDANGMHFGNPFSHTTTSIKQNSIPSKASILTAKGRILASHLLNKDKILDVSNTVDDGLVIVLKPQDPKVEQGTITFDKQKNRWKVTIYLKPEFDTGAVYLDVSELQRIINTIVPKDLLEYFINGLYKIDDKILLERTDELMKLGNYNIHQRTKEILQSHEGSTLVIRDRWGIYFFNEWTNENNYISNSISSETINVESVKNAVEAFEAWLTGESEYTWIDNEKQSHTIDLTLVEPQRREWIVNQIKDRSLRGKPLVYYTELIPDDSYGTTTYDYDEAPNHAHILLKYINGYYDYNVDKFKGLDTRSMLANVRAKDPSTITNDDVLKLLLSIENEQDLALVLSALLSLSTDNAKDLGLAKLNAGSTMIGMYIYGISVGMDFKDIAKIMMSNTAKTLKEVMDENVFQEKQGYINISKAFDYFERGPWSQLMKFDKFLSKYEERSKDSASPLKLLTTNLKIPKAKKGLLNWLITLAKKYSANNLIKLLEEQRNKFVGLELDRVLYQQLIDFCEEYVLLYNNLDSYTLKQLEVLNKGADEMKIIGQISGLNQGIPTDVVGILNKVAIIEDLLPEGISLLDFAFDKKVYNRSTKKYESVRLMSINQLEESKISFNALDMIDKLPHLLKYVQELASNDLMNSMSYRYRSIKNLYKEFKNIYGGSTKDIISGINRYIGDKLIAEWMLDKSISIKIPKGNHLFNPEGVLSEKETEVDTEIILGTDYNNASFRLWMELEVIPNLKLGKLENNGTINPGISENRFIKNLKNDTKTNTNSGNGTIVYTLPINMLPRTDLGKSDLLEYMSEFASLDKYSYNVSGVQIPITDLFTLYTLITYGGKQGESSLMSILEDHSNSGYLEQLHDSITEKDNNFKEKLEITKNVETELKLYLASKSYNSFSNIVWRYNESTNRIELGNKGKNGKVIYNNATINEKLDLNYFPDLYPKTFVKEYINKLDNNSLFKVNWSRGSKLDNIEIITPFLTPYGIVEDHYETIDILQGKSLEDLGLIKMINKELKPDMKIIKLMILNYLEELKQLEEQKKKDECNIDAPF